MWKNVPKEFRNRTFPTFKKYFKTNILLNYDCCETV